MDPSERIDQLTAELTDWRGKTQSAQSLDAASAHLVRLVPHVTIATPFADFIAMQQTLLDWDLRVYDWRDCAVHMILVAQQTILTRHAAGVTGLAEFFLHRTETGHEI